MTKMKAKTPEEEVEPLADPEPDIPPEIHDPDDDTVPDEKAAFGIPPPEKPPSHVLRDEIRERAAARSFDMSGPHHS